MSNPEAVPFQTTLHVRDHCLCLGVHRAARSLARRFDAALAPVGITSGQFSLLMSLNRPASPSIGSVAALLDLNRTTLTANLKPLERRGLVRITVDPKDGRGRLLSLTEAGRTVLRAATPIWQRTHDAVDQRLSPADADALRAGLRAVS